MKKETKNKMEESTYKNSVNVGCPLSSSLTVQFIWQLYGWTCTHLSWSCDIPISLLPYWGLEYEPSWNIQQSTIEFNPLLVTVSCYVSDFSQWTNFSHFLPNTLLKPHVTGMVEQLVFPRNGQETETWQKHCFLAISLPMGNGFVTMYAHVQI